MFLVDARHKFPVEDKAISCHDRVMTWPKSIRLYLVSVALVWNSTTSCSRRSDPPATPQTLDAAKATEVVATLDTAIPKGKNAIWCGSFLAAWKALPEQVAKEPVSLEGGSALAASLNAAPDPRPMIPQADLYVGAGWQDQGVVERIQREMARRFPSRPAPSFPGITPGSFVAYSYLEASLKFSLPYFQSRQPLEFTDSEGRKSRVLSFGIRREDDYAYWKLRQQPGVLFRKGDEFSGAALEFALDLCVDSQPSQIVVARIKREPSLDAAIGRVEKEAEELESLARSDPNRAKHLQSVGPNDVLLVPDQLWNLSHHFKELEGKPLANTKLKPQRLDVAQQDILFRLDRSGAELKSESKTYMTPVPTYFVLDRPFLIYMKQRGAKAPYFAMWVDNAEVLTKWR
jgi:hypothetical protein